MDLEPLDLEILSLIAAGHTVGTVSRRLCLSERTIRRRLRALANANGCGSTIELVVAAVRRGLL